MAQDGSRCRPFVINDGPGNDPNGDDSDPEDDLRFSIVYASYFTAKKGQRAVPSTTAVGPVPLKYRTSTPWSPKVRYTTPAEEAALMEPDYDDDPGPSVHKTSEGKFLHCVWEAWSDQFCSLQDCFEDFVKGTQCRKHRIILLSTGNFQSPEAALEMAEDAKLVLGSFVGEILVTNALYKF